MFRLNFGRICTLAAMCLLCGCSGQQEKAAEVSRPVEPVKPAAPAFGTLTVEPNSGSGRDQVFRVTLTRTPGAPTPALLGLLINKGAAGNDACYVFAEVQSRRFLLVNDTGVGSKEVGKAASVANSQCELLSEQTTTSTNEGAITVGFHVRLRESFKGPMKLYAIAQDANGATPGLQPVGNQWLVQ